MKIELVSVLCGGQGFQTPPSVIGETSPVRVWPNQDNLISPCQAYQRLLEETDNSVDILAYGHDDLEIHSTAWEAMIDYMFMDANVAVVGLGGALTLGHGDLYKRPWRLDLMARGGYGSNATDAEVHGIRVLEPRRVVVLDALFMAVRVKWLRALGGWPVNYLTHHGLDLWLACMASRSRKETWTVPASFTHHGGGSSIKSVYAEAEWLQGGSLDSDHLLPHKWISKEFSDVLPLKVEGE